VRYGPSLILVLGTGALLSLPAARAETLGAVAQASGSADQAAIPYPSDSDTSASDGAGSGTTDGAVPAKKTPMLYGRIDELVSEPGAELPVATPAMAPQLHSTGSAGQPGSGHGSFPESWLGAWSGELTIKLFDYNPLCARFDPGEFVQTQQLMAPGRVGRVRFQFTRAEDRAIDLEPAQVNFAQQEAPHFRLLGNQYASGPPGSRAAGGGWVRIGLVRPVQTPPFLYILHLGLVQPGIGITGNSLSGQLLRDTVRKLAPHVIEQEVITYESDVSRLTGAVAHAYSENVIRFTARDADTLDVEAASVRYGPTGDFVDKVILQGTVRRNRS